MRLRITSLFLCLIACLALEAQVGDLPRSAPAAEGVSTQAVINMMDSLLPSTKICCGSMTV